MEEVYQHHLSLLLLKLHVRLEVVRYSSYYLLQHLLEEEGRMDVVLEVEPEVELEELEQVDLQFALRSSEKDDFLNLD